jgi:hypothetical protein
VTLPAVLRCTAVLFAVCAALTLVVPEASAGGEHARLGPFPQRVRHPIYLMYLQPSPTRAALLAPGSVQVDVNGDWSNVFEKWSRRRPEGRHHSNLDMEILRLGTTVRIGLPWGLEVGVEVPLLTMTGGVADRAIQNWHKALNAENGGRNFVEDFTWSWDIEIPNTFQHIVEEPVVMALGDIVVDVQGQLLGPSHNLPGVAARFLVKLPTGTPKRGTGSGTPDVGVLVSAEHGWGFFNLYGHLGVLALGREGQLANIIRTGAVTFAFTMEFNLLPGWSMLAQLQGHSTFVKEFVHPFVKKSPMGLMFGTRVRVGPVDLSLAMEQDILNGDPTADITLVSSVGFTVGPRREGEGRRGL